MIRKNCSTYCPPHCEFEPDYCPPIDCPDGPICTELIPSDAIIFEGTYLECFGITAGMNLTDVVLTLAALVFPQCNTTTTTSTTSTTTLCQRPQGLTDIILISSFDDGTTIVDFTGSFAEACTASNIISNNTSYFLNTYIGQVSGLGVTGVTVYDTSFLTDCSVIPDGWYIDAADYTQIINIVGGILVSIVGCTITTTSTTSTTTSTTTTTTSTTSTTTTTTVAPFTPSSISNLWAWYKGDTNVTGGAQVTAWVDQSGNSNDLAVVSTNYPEQVSDTVGTLSTQVVKKAVGTNAYLATSTNVPDITSTGVTTFMVVKTNSQSAVIGYMLKNTQFDCYVQNTGNMGGKIGTNTSTFLTGAFPNNVYTTVRWYGSGINQEFAYNGSVVNLSSDASYVYVPNTLRLFTQNGSFGLDQGDNSYAEVLIYTRALSPTEITDVETYLRNKYNHY